MRILVVVKLATSVVSTRGVTQVEDPFFISFPKRDDWCVRASFLFVRVVVGQVHFLVPHLPGMCFPVRGGRATPSKPIGNGFDFA